MNILPKKSWHVRNKDNVAKVRADEAEARERELADGRRVARAAQETRIALLRARHAATSTVDAAAVDKPSTTSLNLFESGDARQNAEHEREKRDEKEKRERQVGLLTYLGGSKSREEAPWYFKAPAPRDAGGGAVDAKRKAAIDPLLAVGQHLAAKKRKSTKSHKRKDASKKRTSSVGGASEGDKLGAMRKARLDRERRERQRSALLLNREGRGEGGDETSEPQADVGYNNQFNPHLARKRPHTFRD